jgi:hypothetical protein
VAVPWHAEGSAIAWDVLGRSVVKLTKGLKFHWDEHDFAFMAADRVIISPPLIGKHGLVTARVVAFSSGKVLSRPRILAGQLFRSSNPGFVLSRRFPESLRGDDSRAPLAAVEVSTGEAILSETPALDVFGSHYLAGLVDGRLGLYERGKGLQSTLRVDMP